GPALHVPEILYKRWERRTGGLTAGWAKLTPPEIKSGLRAVARTELAVADHVPASEAERQALRFCIFLALMRHTRFMAKIVRGTIIDKPEDVHEAFADTRPPPGLDAVDPQIRQWALAAHARIDPWLASLRR
ncbi:MAG: hypothetical protein WD036_02135, partial [Bauldia sp.]